MAEDQEEEAETIQQGIPLQPAMPTQNIRGEEGEAALDHNNNVEESRELGARKKVINLGKRIISKY